LQQNTRAQAYISTISANAVDWIVVLDRAVVVDVGLVATFRASLPNPRGLTAAWDS
jgi:hypothetical protein